MCPTGVLFRNIQSLKFLCFWTLSSGIQKKTRERTFSENASVSVLW
jgi:hypothetical protein